jgi:hypothetical protein
LYARRGHSLIACLAVVASVVCSSLATTAPWERPSLPPFHLEDLAGQSITRADLASGISVLAFLVPGTPSCETTVTMLQQLRLEDHPLRWLVLVPEASEHADAVRTTLGSDWQVAVDAQLLLASVMTVYRVPEMIGLVDGVKASVLEWPFDAEALAAWLTDLETIGVETSADAPDADQQVEATGPFLLGETVGFLRPPEPFILAFAGARCPVCHEMLPQLFALAERHPVWMVITGESEDLSAFASDAPHLWKVIDTEWDLANLFDVHTTPTVLLITTEGALSWGHIGYVQGLGHAFDAFLREESPLSTDL